jgi:ABC-type bacteriocin/lantibiotic exporter with double-glycine peptidase domain
MIQSRIVPILRRMTGLMNMTFPELQVQRLVDRLDNRDNSLETDLNSLHEAATLSGITFIRQEFTAKELEEVLASSNFPILAFEKNVPVVLFSEKRRIGKWKFEDSGETESYYDSCSEFITQLSGFKHLKALTELPDTSSKSTDERFIFTLCPIELNAMVSSNIADNLEGNSEVFTPLKRFLRFAASEKSNIFYIYVYATLIGLINLSLPLGIQAIIGRISGGLLFDGVIVLITFVILGIILSGGLQLMQIYLVEILQRRIFTKAAFEFAFRIPRIRSEALLKYYPPELMNRFFDVITLQKGSSKILLDLTTSFLQILFGLILLSFYHPSFILFGIFLFSLLIVLFRFSGKKALESSLKESSSKYRIVSWFEDMARNINTFKIAGHTNMPLDYTDGHIDNYLKARKKHFSHLLNQFIYVLVFKILITGGTLIMGCILVVEREITLGQFVASEIIIILVINAVEKLIFSIETVYDVLTAVEKIGQVHDLPLEKQQGIRIQHQSQGKGLNIEVKDVSFAYSESSVAILHNLNFEIQAGENVCITGLNGSGKQTLSKLLSGILTSYTGLITVNGISLRNIHLNDLHELVSLNLSGDEIFQGSVEENVRLGKPGIAPSDVIEALQKAGIADFVNTLPEGIYTQVMPGGRGWPGSAARKLILARSLVKKPALFIFHDHFTSIGRKEKSELIQRIFDDNKQTTIIAISSDPLVMTACSRLIVLKNGTVEASGDPQTLINNPALADQF